MDIDTDVKNYTLPELIAIAGVNNMTSHEITKKTNALIDRFSAKNDTSLVNFFKDVQYQLLYYAKGLSIKNKEESDNNNQDNNETEETPDKIIVETFDNMSSNSNSNNEAIYPSGQNQFDNWFSNEYLSQKNKVQHDKITDRKQKIQVFEGGHAPMDREQIATTDTFQVPVKQDSLNPNLKNTISRFVNLDSQFRQYTGGPYSSSTCYTCDLSDTLKDALSLRVYSYQIPYSWYTIDANYGNTCFWIQEGEYSIAISIPPGNYNTSSFQTQLTQSFTDAGFTFPDGVSPVVINSGNGILTLNLFGGVYNDPTSIIPSFTITTSTIICFFDFTNQLLCTNNCLSKSNHFFNGSLGWLMGYRSPYMNVEVTGNTASAIIDLNGPKYLILVIDDYNQNHVNNTLVSITQFSSNLKVPSYYSPDLPTTCSTQAQTGINLQQLIDESVLDSVFNPSQNINNSQNINGLLIAGKYNGDYSANQIVLPSAPRTLTQAQIYTINEINNNNNNVTNYLSKAPTSADILAIIPIKTSTGVPTGSLLVDFSGSLQESVRTYFGPVNIERMCVKLLDDKGNVLNLNGNDWCVTLVCECLYQY
jgi:hypothetical protein